MIMLSMDQSVELVEGEIEVFGENLSQCYFMLGNSTLCNGNDRSLEPAFPLYLSQLLLSLND
jgi:hypothetical protein